LRTWLTTATSLETQLPSNSASSASTISEIKLFASAYSRLAETSRVVHHWSSQCTEKFWHGAVPKNRETPAKRIGHFSGHVHYLKISAQPLLQFFFVSHRYRKINKGRRAVSCEADKGVDSDSKALLCLSAVSRL
jgi:hypothetical protein